MGTDWTIICHPIGNKLLQASITSEVEDGNWYGGWCRSGLGHALDCTDTIIVVSLLYRTVVFFFIVQVVYTVHIVYTIYMYFFKVVLASLSFLSISGVYYVCMCIE